MDPAHRDRIAFLRVASGGHRGMRLKVVRKGQGTAAQHGGELHEPARRELLTPPCWATSSASPTTACCSWATR
jgi:hypothetical protein